MKYIISTVFAAVLTPGMAYAQYHEVGPACLDAPPFSIPSVEKCYEFACENFRYEYSLCNTQACRLSEYLEYLDALDFCDLSWKNPPLEDSALSQIEYFDLYLRDIPAISLPICALGGNNPLLLSIDLGFVDSEPVPEGVIVLSDGTWYEPVAQN